MAIWGRQGRLIRGLLYGVDLQNGNLLLYIQQLLKNAQCEQIKQSCCDSTSSYQWVRLQRAWRRSIFGGLLVLTEWTYGGGR